MTDLADCYYCRQGQCGKCIDTQGRVRERVCGCPHTGAA